MGGQAGGVLLWLFGLTTTTNTIEVNMKDTTMIIMVFAWLGGIVFSKGFLSAALAICLPPYAWYLFVEYLFLFFGLTQ